jgi:hypothetical protein
LEALSAMKCGGTLTARLKEDREAPCLSVSCVESHRAFACSYQGQDQLLFLVEDILSEGRSFLTYIEEALAPDQMLLSLEAVRSAVQMFYEYQGDVQQCIAWISEE